MISALETRLDQLEGNALELAALRMRNAELESAAKESLGPATRAPTSATFNLDDLQQIRGIGPAFERALHAHGVLTFAQIAAWTEHDISEVAKALGIKASRIHKADWVGSAKAQVSKASIPE
jgi:large subunit ribosomal protein L21